MAKIVIAGDAVVVTSELTLEDYRTIEKYRPETLIVKGGETGREPVFRVGTTKQTGEINQYGASFGAESHDGNRLATITLIGLADNGADIKEAVADKLGKAIIQLNKLEETLPDVLAEIQAEKTTIMSNITVAQ